MITITDLILFVIMCTLISTCTNLSEINDSIKQNKTEQIK